MAGLELAQSDEPGLLSQRTTAEQVVGDGPAVGLARAGRARQESLDLGGEGQVRRGGLIEERLDAQTIARREQRALALIPDGEREHPVEAAETLLAETLIEVEQHFGVGSTDEVVAGGSEVLGELHVVVDLAVEDDPQIAIVADHGLVTRRREIDNRQPPRAKADRARDVQPRVIRSPVSEPIAHGHDHRGSHRRAVGADDAYDAAHGVRTASRGPPITFPCPAPRTCGVFAA